LVRIEIGLCDLLVIAGGNGGTYGVDALAQLREARLRGAGGHDTLPACAARAGLGQLHDVRHEADYIFSTDNMQEVWLHLVRSLTQLLGFAFFPARASTGALSFRSSRDHAGNAGISPDGRIFDQPPAPIDRYSPADKRVFSPDFARGARS
jgi:hypothetical protein